MDSTLAVLFYIGIVVPTAITITVFIGFLVCLYKRNVHKKRGGSRSRLIENSRPVVHEKFESSSQHSNDSAIDLREIDMHMDLTRRQNGKPGLLLDATRLTPHADRYEVGCYYYCLLWQHVH